MTLMKKEAVAVVLFFCTVLYGLGTTEELRQEGKYWIGESQKTFKVEKSGSLVMDEIQGEVVIKGWDKNEVSIHEIKKMDIFTKAEAEAAMKSTETGYVQEGNTIRVGGPAFDRNWIHSTFTIFIPAEMECNIKNKGGSLSVENTKGNVTASSGGGEIVLQNVGGIINTSTGGGEVSITESSGPVIASTGGGEIHIEKTKNRVKVSAGGGEVEIQDTQGCVEVKTGGGDVRISGVKGDVTVGTGGGEVYIQDVTGNIQGTTGGGSIEVNNLKGNISASTGGGDVELNGIAGGIEASTGGGDVTAELTLVDFSANHKVMIRTGSGDIRLTLPEKIPATVQAKINVQGRRDEDFQISSDFPLKITTSDMDRRAHSILASGDLNGGGDPINLETTDGYIHIQKAKK